MLSIMPSSDDDLDRNKRMMMSILESYAQAKPIMIIRVIITKFYEISGNIRLYKTRNIINIKREENMRRRKIEKKK